MDTSHKHLRVSGYHTFVNVPKDERLKLIIFVGLGNNNFGYRLHDLIEKMLTIS